MRFERNDFAEHANLERTGASAAQSHQPLVRRLAAAAAQEEAWVAVVGRAVAVVAVVAVAAAVVVWASPLRPSYRRRSCLRVRSPLPRLLQ